MSCSCDGERLLYIAQKQDGSLFILVNTVLVGNVNEVVVLKEYAATKEGLIKSWVDRVSGRINESFN